MFLIRAAFWLSVAVLFIPAGQSEEQQAQAQTVSTGEAILAAQSLWSDVSGFCQRNPEVCETGGTALQTFSLKARNGARMLYEFFDDGSVVAPQPLHASADGTDGSDPVTTGTITRNGKL